MSSKNSGCRRCETFHIILGEYCNELCRHCCQRCGPHHFSQVNEDEILKITDATASLFPKTILFTGGEPTFYWPQIRKIRESIKNIKNENNLQFKMTTNGLWAKSTKLIEDFKDDIIYCLTHIQLSYNVKFGHHIDDQAIFQLKNFCDEFGIDLSLIVILSEGIDISLLPLLAEKFALPITYQTVHPVGRGRKLPSLQMKGSQNKKCPHRGVTTYQAGKGFTFCCSRLGDYEHHSQLAPFVFFEHYEDLVKNDFSHSLQQLTLDEVAKELGVMMDDSANDALDECAYCEQMVVKMSGAK